MEWRYVTDSFSFVASSLNYDAIVPDAVSYLTRSYVDDVVGWLLPSTTGTYTLSMSSKYKAYVWIGSEAAYPTSSSTAVIRVNTSGGVISTVTYSATLTAGVYYPIRIQHSSQMGQYWRFVFRITPPGGSSTATIGPYVAYPNVSNANDNVAVNANNVSFTSQGSDSTGSHALMKAYVVLRVGNVDSYVMRISMNATNNSGASLMANDALAFFAGDSLLGNTQGLLRTVPSKHNVQPSGYFMYTVSGEPTIASGYTDLSVYHPSSSSIRINFRNQYLTGLTWAVPVRKVTQANSIYYAGHGYTNNLQVTLSVQSGTAPGGLTGGTTYYVDVVNNNYFRLKSSATGAVRELTSHGDGAIRFSHTLANPAANAILANNHELFNGSRVVYNNKGNADIPGLVNGNTYIVLQSSSSSFKLATAATPSVVADITAAGSGTHSVSNTADRALDGNFTISQVADPNSFVLQTSSSIPARTLSFSHTSSVITRDNTIVWVSHRMRTGSAVTYSANGNSPIGSLSDNETYFVIRKDLSTIALASTIDNAKNGIALSIDTASTGVHQLTCKDIIGELVSSRMVALTAKSDTLRTTNVDFLAAMRPGDALAMEVPVGGAARAISSITASTQINFALPHGLYGEPVVYYENSSRPIAGLTNGAVYFAKAYSTTAVQLYTTQANANAGTNTIALTDPVGATGGAFGTLTPSARTVASVSGATITMVAPHLFMTGDKVTYYEAGGALSPLLSNSNYYVRNTGTSTATTLTLHPSFADAASGTNSISISAGPSPAGVLVFAGRSFNAVTTTSSQITMGTSATSVLGAAVSTSISTGDAVQYTEGSRTITGLTNNFIYYARFVNLGIVTLHTTYAGAVNNDNMVLLTAVGSTGTYGMLTPLLSNKMHETTVKAVNTSSLLTMSTAAPVSAAGYGTLITTTSMYPRADGLAIHRPFDGGVQIVPSSNPDSQIIRQTRRYFRYQSGKGIQCSMAVNFSAPNDIQSISREGTTAMVKTRRPHRLTTGCTVLIEGAAQLTDGATFWDGTYEVTSIPDAMVFTFELVNVPPETEAEGIPMFYAIGWTNAAIRAGMYDDQNGLFFEYDGQKMYAVRRNSVTQVPGAALVTFNSSLVRGEGTTFLSQFHEGERIVIKGMTYKITKITTNTQLYVQPPYRGVSRDDAIITKTIDTRIAQSDWNVDKCDGTGPSGFDLDIHKIQMIYIDYAWYGAGKVRFGFKGTKGDVFYAHEFIHNNHMTEAYMRSGNLPARYEVATTGIPTYVPALMHWGASVIIDGKFDDDKAYMFVASNTLRYTGGNQQTFTANVASSSATKVPGTSKMGHAITCSAFAAVVQFIPDGTPISGSNIPVGTVTIGNVQGGTGDNGTMYLSQSPTASATSVTLTAGSGTDYLSDTILLLSMRLAPAVDNGRPGSMGTRDIVNRMQVALESISICGDPPPAQRDAQHQELCTRATAESEPGHLPWEERCPHGRDPDFHIPSARRRCAVWESHDQQRAAKSCPVGGIGKWNHGWRRCVPERTRPVNIPGDRIGRNGHHGAQPTDNHGAVFMEGKSGLNYTLSLHPLISQGPDRASFSAANRSSGKSLLQR